MTHLKLKELKVCTEVCRKECQATAKQVLTKNVSVIAAAAAAAECGIVVIPLQHKTCFV